MAAVQGAKRKRVEEEVLVKVEASTSESTAFRRGNVWFDDGNVLLIAETTSFRVHKSILSRHSEFFNDMFRLPQPAYAGGDTDVPDAQCPAVHTSESAADLAHFLGAIYNSVRYVHSVLPSSSSPPIYHRPLPCYDL